MAYIEGFADVLMPMEHGHDRVFFCLSKPQVDHSQEPLMEHGIVELGVFGIAEYHVTHEELVDIVRIALMPLG